MNLIRARVVAELRRLGVSAPSAHRFEVAPCDPSCVGLYPNAETGEVERCDECAHSAGVQEIWTDETAAALVRLAR